MPGNAEILTVFIVVVLAGCTVPAVHPQITAQNQTIEPCERENVTFTVEDTNAIAIYELQNGTTDAPQRLWLEPSAFTPEPSSAKPSVPPQFVWHNQTTVQAQIPMSVGCSESGTVTYLIQACTLRSEQEASCTTQNVSVQMQNTS